MALEELSNVRYAPYVQPIVHQNQQKQPGVQAPSNEDVNAEGAAVSGAITAAATMGAGAVGATTGAAAGVAFGALTGRVEKPQNELFKAQVGTSDIFKSQVNKEGTGYQNPMENYRNGLAPGNVLPEDATQMFIA